MILILAAALVDAGPTPLEAGPRDTRAGDAGVLAAAYGLEVGLDAQGVQPGDQIWLEIKLRYDKSLAVELPSQLPEGQGLAPVGPAERRPESQGTQIHETLRFPFVLLALQGVRSPAFSLRVGDDELKVPALPLQVQDAGPSAEPPDPDLKTMVVYRPGPAPWVLPTLGLLVLLGVVFWLGRRWWLARPEAEPEPEPEVDPGAVFRGQLEAMRSRMTDEPEVLKAVWFELLECLRSYLDLRFGLHSTQSTTEEMLSALASARLTGFPRVGLKALLERADAVRYAGVEPEREPMADLFDEVERWVATAEASHAQRVDA